MSVGVFALGWKYQSPLPLICAEALEASLIAGLLLNRRD